MKREVRHEATQNSADRKASGGCLLIYSCSPSSLGSLCWEWIAYRLEPPAFNSSPGCQTVFPYAFFAVDRQIVDFVYKHLRKLNLELSTGR